jgi:Fe-S-cluster containining protein
MTTNEQASLCLAKEDFEEEAAPTPALRCALLEGDRCRCYEARPFMCRMMVSSTRCDETGHAQMPSLLVSLNTVCLQIVEDMDRRGWSGYLSHVLPHFAADAPAKACSPLEAIAEDTRVRRNRPSPGFLVPPEDRAQIQSWLRDLDNRLRAM